MRVGAFPLGLMPFLTPEISWLPVCAYKLNFLWSAIDQAPPEQLHGACTYG